MKCRKPPTCAHCLRPAARHSCRMKSCLSGRTRLVMLCDRCERGSRPPAGRHRMPADQPHEPRDVAELAESAAGDRYLRRLVTGELDRDD